MLVRGAMPTKIKVGECVLLISRMSKASAFDIRSAVRTSTISVGIGGAYQHLTDMKNAGLIERKPGRIKHFFVDESNAPKIFVPFDQIDATWERSISEITRQAVEKERTGKAILDFLGIEKPDEIYDKLHEEYKLYNDTVDMLKSKRLLDSGYKFDNIGWRNSSHRWYLGAPILQLA